MSLATKPLSPHRPDLPPRRLWTVSVSKSWWWWLLLSIVTYAGMHLWFLQRMRHVSPHQIPGTGPMSIFGWLSLALMALATAYTLRRRYLRMLPGQAQDWLWMHIWVGAISALVALLHANYDHIFYNINLSLPSLLSGDAGPLSGYALVLLALSGVVGRLLDRGYARVMSREATTNGVGIPQAVERRITELEAMIERLSAGKSGAFQQYCHRAMQESGTLPAPSPPLASQEQADFHRMVEVFADRTRLLHSLSQQRRATQIMRWWRIAHITLAIFTVLIVCLHVGIAAGPGLLRRLHLLH